MSTSYEIEWPSTTDRTASVPLCINQEKEIAYRECTDGEWGPEPECVSVQSKNPPECPSGFVEKGDICYTFTKKTIFIPSCPFPDPLPFPSFVDLITDKLREPVWVPVIRDFGNGLGFIRWIEPSEFYKQEYGDYNYTRNPLTIV